MTVTITFANRKGGVGKTTSAVTLADGLARQGQRVLLVDLDSQGHAGLALGMPKGDALYRWLVQGEDLGSVSTIARPNLSLVAGGSQNELVNTHLQKQKQGLKLLWKLASRMVGVDVLVLDTPPGMCPLQDAALIACDLLVIPVVMEKLALISLDETLHSVAELRKEHPRAAQFGIRILPTLFERTAQEQKHNFQQLADAYGTILWPPIPRDARVREAQAQAKTLWEAASGTAAIQYNMNGKRVGGYQPILERILEMIT